VEFVLLRPKDEIRSFFNRVGLRKPNFSHTIPDRDEAGFQALSELRDYALNEVANAVAQSCDHVLSFFRALRAELAFYLGCLNLQRRLAAAGGVATFPVPVAAEEQAWTADGLYDVCLCLRIGQPVVANTVDADGATLVMVTGANRGGKSTFLRSVGLAALMMGAGMFVGAQQLRAGTRTGVFTHFKREEDDTMSSGKFDEELARVSALANDIRPRSLVLCNESFQATNELEGSEIGRQVIRALTDAGVTVVFVTHLYDLARSLYARDAGDRLFLRAERDPSGERTFRVVPGEPLPTSHGLDIYDRVFRDT
jgi:DNA mismatch repair ATPase MutS